MRNRPDGSGQARSGFGDLGFEAGGRKHHSENARSSRIVSHDIDLAQILIAPEGG